MKLSRVCYFHCSKCNHAFKKEDNLRGWKIAIMTPDISPSVSGTLTCQYCGNIIQCQEIYSGKYDVPKKYWPDLSPPHEVLPKRKREHDCVAMLCPKCGHDHCSCSRCPGNTQAEEVAPGRAKPWWRFW